MGSSGSDDGEILVAGEAAVAGAGWRREATVGLRPTRRMAWVAGRPRRSRRDLQRGAAAVGAELGRGWAACGLARPRCGPGRARSGPGGPRRREWRQGDAWHARVGGGGGGASRWGLAKWRETAGGAGFRGEGGGAGSEEEVGGGWRCGI
nr:heterogeneous nuclear ribonucleoprotein A1-like [Aegilops tauschii subsp. strangulata]